MCPTAALLAERLLLHEERPSATRTVPGWTTREHRWGVQQKLMRHAQISTTMKVYGNALMEAKREANTKGVRKALRSA
jgi:integrase